MKKKVNLKAVIDALESVDDETSAFYDLGSGDFVYWSEYGDNDIEADEIDDAVDEGRLIKLMDRFEINEYHMMQSFAYDHEDDRLIRAIQGRGAFRHFKDTADDIGLIDEWYEFRDNCYRERAERWCRDHDLEWTE